MQKTLILARKGDTSDATLVSARAEVLDFQDKVISLEAALSEAARDSVSESARTARVESALRSEISALVVRLACQFLSARNLLCVCAFVFVFSGNRGPGS